MLKIGEFARQGGVSVKALRHYHRLDLLVPVYVDRFSGYRYYREEQLADLHLLLYLRSLGLSLAQVGEVLAAADAEELRNLLHLREEELQHELAALPLGEQPIQKRGADVSHVKPARGARRKSDDFGHDYSLGLKMRLRHTANRSPRATSWRGRRR